jgi:excisionase family DNA binding protein
VGVHRGVRRVPLREAAQLLGVSKDAVRQRIRRGTIRSEKGEDGRVYVFVDASPDTARPQADHAGHAYVQAEGARQHADPAPLVEELREQVRYLRDQLDQERDANRENRRIIAALTARIPELEAPASGAGTPSDERESPESATPPPGRVGPQTEVEGPMTEGTERMSWWRRVFGG